jgi:hypothetical protein
MSASVVSWHAVMVQFLVFLLSLNWCGCVLMYRNVTTCSKSVYYLQMRSMHFVCGFFNG